MTLAHPRVSTEASRRTIAFCLAMARVPRESAIVTTPGRPSGIAATVRVTATRIMNSHEGVSGCSGSLVLSAMPTTKTTRHTAMAMYPSFTASASRLCCRGLWPDLVSGKQLLLFGFVAIVLPFSSTCGGASGSSSPPPSLSSAAMVPTRVRMPVATMMPTAGPP